MLRNTRQGFNVHHGDAVKNEVMNADVVMDELMNALQPLRQKYPKIPARRN